MKLKLGNIILLVFFFWFIVLSAQPSLADSSSNYVQKINYSLEQPFGGKSQVANWGEYIQTVYSFAVGLVAIIAVVLIMIGGMRWIVAAGNDSAISEAREMITSAVIGLVIALLSYTLLVFINPQLVIQNFSVAEIPIPNSNTDFWKRPWCNANNPAISSLECNSSSSGKVTCSNVTCGDTALYELNGKTQMCRGSACPSGDGSPTCSPSSSNPYSSANCVYDDCSTRLYKCYNKYPDPAQNASFNQCLCEYYQEIVMPLMGKSTDPNSYDAPTLVEFAVFCNEDVPQSKLVTDIPAKPTVYSYTGAAADLKQKGLNCNFGCQLDNSSSVTGFSAVNWGSASSITNWITANPSRTLQCKKS